MVWYAPWHSVVGLEWYFGTQRPRAVLVVGDVNSTMAPTIVCAEMGISCACIEAVLRPGDWSMPEQVNRVVTDSIVDLLLTPPHAIAQRGSPSWYPPCRSRRSWRRNDVQMKILHLFPALGGRNEHLAIGAFLLIEEPV